eukprot:g19177.t1
MANNNISNGLGAAALIQQLGNELTREDDNIRHLWSQIEGLTGDNRPSMEDFKRALKVVKQKEMWVLGREYVTTPDKVRIEPAHLFTAMGVPIAALGADPLLTRQQRDDAVAKYMSAANSITKSDSVQVVGECLLDMQILSIETPATTYIQRVHRWWQNDWETRLRNNHEKVLKFCQENDELLSQALMQFSKCENVLSKGGKRGEKPICRHFLQQKCTRGSACRFKHPESKNDFSEADFELTRNDFPFLRSLTYGSWWKSSTAAPAAADAA